MGPPSEAARRRSTRRLPFGTITVFGALALASGGTALFSQAGVPQFGVARTGPAPLACATVGGQRLNAGTRARLVVFDPIRWTDAEIVRHRAEPCEPSGLLEGAAYDLRLGHLDAAAGEIAVVLVGTGIVVSVSEDRALVTHPAAGEPLVVARCFGTEGINFVARQGRRRVWHAYYYLGFDIEPTCTDDDVGDSPR